MGKFFERLDHLAGIAGGSAAAVWLERASFIFLVITLTAAPHSIAATQTAWIAGMLLWIVRLFYRPRIKLKFGPLDWALGGFFLWSVVSSLVSYEPAVSINKLRGTALFLIFYFVIYNLRNRRAVFFAVGVLIVSCMVNVVWTPVSRAVGRGVAVHGVRPDSPLAKATITDGDAIFEVNGKKVRYPEEVIAAIDNAETSRVKAYRVDYDITVNIARADLLPGTTAAERLGFTSWGRTRNWRSSGFYGHYTTYAEVLQLLASLVLGLLVAGFFAGRKTAADDTEWPKPRGPMYFAGLFLSLAGMCLALLLTVTRASQLAFIISGFVVFVRGASRRWLIAAFAVGVPAVLVGLFILQQSRNVGFFDSGDSSIQYRRMMWRDGVRLWTESPRHLIAGVGMDSIQKRWQEWDMFDKGWQPMGHFHSTPIQLLAERGLPALLLWLAILAVYARTLWRGIGRAPDRLSRGVLLGCLGGMIGFFASGLVHYNIGDQEVAMVFFILMAVSVRLAALNAEARTQ